MPKSIFGVAVIAALLLTACENFFTDSRDGKKYKVVKIGEQTWMAENLNYNADGSKCYEEQESNCQKYGRLYNWEMAMKACPSGWHLPSDAEWQSLVDFAGGEGAAGKRLKTSSGWNKNGNGTDAFGFSALPGGYSISSVAFNYVGNGGYWWGNSSNNDIDNYYWNMDYEDDGIGYNFVGMGLLYSVRCLQD